MRPSSVSVNLRPEVRTSALGLLLLSYYAQYYLLGGTAGAGRVNASVTYALTYS